MNHRNICSTFNVIKPSPLACYITPIQRYPIRHTYATPYACIPYHTPMRLYNGTPYDYIPYHSPCLLRYIPLPIAGMSVNNSTTATDRLAISFANIAPPFRSPPIRWSSGKLLLLILKGSLELPAIYIYSLLLGLSLFEVSFLI